MDMTSYSPALEHTINSYQMIARDSRQEIEIRAHCLYATALLREEVNKLVQPICRSSSPRSMPACGLISMSQRWPHHLTKTIMY